MAVTAGKILIVEDDDSMRGSIERLLGAAGLASAAYASAEALLASGAARGAACVISDLKLPGMSGLELLAELRAQGGALPLVLITAHDTPGLCEEAARRGAAAYLKKPFRGTELLQQIGEAIETAHLPK